MEMAILLGVFSHLHAATSGDMERLHITSSPAHCTWKQGIDFYPLVNIQKAMVNGHRNSGFTHE
jgi:hypothetical protein